MYAWIVLSGVWSPRTSRIYAQDWNLLQPGGGGWSSRRNWYWKTLLYMKWSWWVRKRACWWNGDDTLHSLQYLYLSVSTRSILWKISVKQRYHLNSVPNMTYKSPRFLRYVLCATLRTNFFAIIFLAHTWNSAQAPGHWSTCRKKRNVESRGGTNIEVKIGYQRKKDKDTNRYVALCVV